MRYILTTIFIGLLFDKSTSQEDGIQRHVDKHYFDILIFTQQWPATVCFTWKEKDKSNQCILPSPKEIWTIHGIWPTKYHTKGPFHCNDSLPFSDDQLVPIKPMLEQFWLNIEKGTAFDSLWRHEWEKHGTCAAQLPQLGTEIKYFGQGLSWLQQFSMSSLLSQANIFPGNAYDLKDINHALTSTLKVAPAISCVRDSASGKSFLFEIKLCFDKSLKMTDCNGILALPGWKETDDILSNCDHTKQVFYPSVVPPTKHDVVAETDFEDNETHFLKIPIVKLYKLIKILQWVTL